MQSEEINQHNWSLEYFSLTGVVFSFGYFFSFILLQKASWVDLLVKTNLKHEFWGCTIVYTQKRIRTPLFFLHMFHWQGTKQFSLILTKITLSKLFHKLIRPYHQTKGLGPVHTNPFSNENGAVLLRLRLLSTLQRRKQSPKTEPFENALHSGAIWKRCF